MSFHHPQIIGKERYRTQLLKQNSCQRMGIRLLRFSTEDIRFAERFEDDIRSCFGPSASRFVDTGIVVERPFELNEHEEGALDKMERLLREAGIPAHGLSGYTRHPERVMDDFRAGRLRFLCSRQMISEGWDYPELGILVMVRPTLSRVLYAQQLGRGL